MNKKRQFKNGRNNETIFYAREKAYNKTYFKLKYFDFHLTFTFSIITNTELN